MENFARDMPRVYLHAVRPTRTLSLYHPRSLFLIIRQGYLLRGCRSEPQKYPKMQIDLLGFQEIKWHRMNARDSGLSLRKKAQKNRLG